MYFLSKGFVFYPVIYLYIFRVFCAAVGRLTGISPFKGRTTDETYLNVTQATSPSLSAAAWQPVSDYAKDWVSKLLVKDSKKRMDVNDALAHPWLSVSDDSASHSRYNRLRLKHLFRKSLFFGCRLL